jgi:HK97 gp10 family phage protein
MSEVLSISITGLDEIEKRLQALPEKIRRRYVRKALQDGTEIIRAEAQLRVPRRKPNSGWESFVQRGETLRDAVATKISVRQGDALGRVGLDYKKVHYGHLVEFGTRPHKIRIKTRSGKYRTIQHPGARKQPFMRPAFDNKGDESVEVMITELAAAVEKEV